MGIHMDIIFPKLYRYDRLQEHVSVAVPFREGTLFNKDDVQIWDGETALPVQSKVTSRHRDGSIRYLFVRFMADLPANKGKRLQLSSDGRKKAGRRVQEIAVHKTEDGFEVNAGVDFSLKNNSGHLFEYVKYKNRVYKAEQFAGPYVTEENGCLYEAVFTRWEEEEKGPLVSVFSCMGSCPGKKKLTFEIKVTCYAEKPYLEIRYRLINTTSETLHIKSMVFWLLEEGTDKLSFAASGQGGTGAYHTVGIRELAEIEEKVGYGGVRTCVAGSNYKTDFYIGENGRAVEKYIDEGLLLGEANEHFPEVFYGTFFADRTDAEGGICATIFQAQQNFPKAVRAEGGGITLMLVPEGIGSVQMKSGMSREQRFLLHFHDAGETLAELDNRSLIYQMPDRPYIAPQAFAEAGVMPDIFVEPEKADWNIELFLAAKCDGHARALGMMAFGDAPDMNYMAQGRGGGRVIWSNNEYDFPHACILLYARSGERRFLDYAIAAAGHWMDVDVCHYSENPLYMGGQWEHCAGHTGGKMLCSHEWVEGLLDYYHFTGEKRAFDTAVGIGKNVLRLLEQPEYKAVGESSARETGWALRSLTALYVETWDEKWLKKADEIIAAFKEWSREYGGWLSPYTDNTIIRVDFMIAVAVGSLMRYYRVFPREDVKEMLLSAIEDLLENGMLPMGVFYYKELPSLRRVGNNPLLLEALTIGYELTGDIRYLKQGMQTFRLNTQSLSGAMGQKCSMEDAVVYGGASPKSFAQCCEPLLQYYKALTDNDLRF